jgi:hypothetical protein
MVALRKRWSPEAARPQARGLPDARLEDTGVLREMTGRAAWRHSR